MKTKILLLALLFSFAATGAFAQRDRSYNNRNDSRTEYGARIRKEARKYNHVMSAKEFRQAMKVVGDAGFDQDKMKAARFIASHNYMTASQIGTMASLFSFDDAKLAFSKYAYARCVDPQNYHLVTRVFSFSSTKERLFDYLARV